MMNIKREYKIFLLESKIKQVRKSLWTFHYIIPIIHLMFVVILTLLKTDFQFEGSLLFIRKFLISIESNYLTSQKANQYMLVGNAICILGLIFSMVRFILIPNFNEPTKHKTLEKILFIMTVMISYFSQLIIYPVTWSFGVILKAEGFSISIVAFVVPFYSYTYCTYKDSTLSLYEWLTIPVALCFSLLSSLPSYVFFCVLSVYMIMRVNIIFKKISYSIIFLFVIMVIKNLMFTQENESEKLKMSLFSFSIILLLASIVIKNSKDSISLSSVDIQLDKCYHTLMSVKGEDPLAQLGFSQFYQLYSSIVSFSMSNRQIKYSEIDTILQKPLESVLKQDLLILMEIYLGIQIINAAKCSPFKQILLLKVRLALNRSSNTILSQLYILNQDLMRQSGNYKTYFFQVFDQIVNRFAIFYQTQLQVTRVIQLNKMKQQMQTKVQYLLQKVDAFWQKMSSQHILISSLDYDLYEALKAMNELERLYKKLQGKSKGTFDKEQKIISLTKILLNSYRQDTKQSNQIKHLQRKFQEQTNLAFMIVDENKIKFISNELIKEVNCKKAISYQNEHINSFFGPEFSPIIEQSFKNLTVQSQNQWIRIPVTFQKGIAEIKKVKIFWMPSLESQNKIMIKFGTVLQNIQDSLFIYNSKTDTIGYFNQNFIEKFGIDTQKLTSQIKHSQIFFNEFFLNFDTAPEVIKKNLKTQNAIRCNIYLKKFTSNGLSEPLPVEISRLSSIKFFEESDYFILRINKLRDKKHNFDRINSVTTSSDQRTLNPTEKEKITQNNKDKNNQLANQYANQKFFCKIPNHYEKKITEKQSQLEQTDRWSYRYSITILFGLILTAILVFWVLDSTFMAARFSKYNQHMNAIQNTSEQYALLYQAYTLALTRYYLKNYLMKYVPAKSVPWEVVDSEYAQKQQQTLNKFIQKYLYQINSQPNNLINYHIEFKYYSIKTNTGYSTLMDFAQNIKRHISDSNITFLLRNYDNLRKLTIQYENSFSNQKFMEDIISQTSNLEWIMMSIFTFSMFIVLALVLKIQHSIGIIYTIINEIKMDTINQCLNNFSKQKRLIIRIINKNSLQFKQSHNPKSLRYLLNHSSEAKSQVQTFYTKSSSGQVSQQMSKLTGRASFNQNKRYTNEEISFRGFCSSNSLGSSCKSSLRIKVVKSVPEKRISDQALLARVIRKAFFILVILGFNGVFYYDYTKAITQKTGIMQLFEIKQQFYVAMLHVKRSQVDAPMIPTQRHFYNISLEDPYHDEQISLVTPIPHQIIIDEMEDFGSQASNILQTDMCKFGQLKVLGSSKPCQKYLNGAVARGFKQSYDIYLKNAKFVGGQELQKLSYTQCTSGNCSPYQEHIATSNLMDSTLQHMIKTFNIRLNQGFDSMLRRAQTMSVIKCVGLLGVLVLYYFYYKELKRKCLLALKYFTVIPKNVMCTITVTNFLRKNDVLKKLDIL